MSTEVAGERAGRPWSAGGSVSGAPEAGARRQADGLAPLLALEEEKLLACVHCGFCLPACPTYRELGDEADSPRGRLHLMRAVGEGLLDAGDPAFQLHIDRCLGCRACEPVCPSGVRYGELLEVARHDAARARPPSTLQRLLLWVFSSRSRTTLFNSGGRVLRALGLGRLVGRRLPDGPPFHPVRLGLAMLDASAPARLQPRAPSSTPHEERESTPRDAPGGRVAVLSGCVQRGLFSRVGQATRRTLEANGYQVVGVPGQGCCGALHAHGGSLDEARRLARANIRAFEAAGVDWIATDAAGCGAAMKGYESLFEHDGAWRERAAGVAGRVRDVSELLALAGPRPGGALPVAVAYDPPCHLKHGQGVDHPVRALLSAIPGLVVKDIPDADTCCGGAGVYGLSHRELGGAIGRKKVEAIRSVGADVVATGNPGCMMQIGGGLLLAGEDLPVVHPVELLDESYRRGRVYGSGV